MKHLTIILSILLIITSTNYAWTQTITIDINNPGSSGTGYTVSGDVVNITGAGTYTINGTGVATTNRILVSGDGTKNITLNNVNIDVGSTAFEVTGTTVNLTLTGDNYLKSGNWSAGLQVLAGANLTIVAASTGSLTAQGDYAAGIGKCRSGSGCDGGNITISGGTVTAIGGYGGSGGIGGANNITITGGTVTATGGIGYDNDNITISGGTVTATGSSDRAGIGHKNNIITISGGTVIATGGSGGAGIGTNLGGSAVVISISGGTVTATGGQNSAGIGGGYTSGGGDITISGGTVTASGNNGGASIGSGLNASSGTIKITGGSIKSTNGSIAPQPTNGSGSNVYLNTLTVGDPAVGDNTGISAGSINGVLCTTSAGTADNYGIKDVKTDAQGKVYFYLPASGGSNQPVVLTATSLEYRKSYTRIADNTNAAILAPPYGITLSQTSEHTFTSAVYGYGDQSSQAKTITVNNVGYEPTGNLTVALSGTNPSSFTLSATTINSIEVGGNNTFTVVPKTGLSGGTYTATVTVSGTDFTDKTFNVSFTVNQANQANFTFDQNSRNINCGETINLYPSGGSGNGSISWSSSNEAVANVSYVYSDGIPHASITANSQGTAIITATKADDGNYYQAFATCTINVSKSTPAAPSLSAEKTADSVTLYSNDRDLMYAMSMTNQAPAISSGSWQSSPGFSGLAPGENYYFFAYRPADDCRHASPVSEGLKVVPYIMGGETVIDIGTGKSVPGDFNAGPGWSVDFWTPGEVSSGGHLDIYDGANVTITGTGSNIEIFFVDNPPVGDEFETEDSTTITLDNANITSNFYISSSTVNLRLKGNNIINSWGKSGLEISGGSVTINAITTDGSLTANGGAQGAGIGGNAYGGGCTVVINSGTIIANGSGYGAGIGGGYLSDNDRGWDGGTVIINGGTVIATGGASGGAGIGGGGSGGGHQAGAGGSITINGGTVTATGSAGGAGIGGGRGGDQFDTSGSGGNVNITAGTVVATGSGGAEDIGKGNQGNSSGTLTITGGSINAHSVSTQATNGSNPVYLNTLTVGSSANANNNITAGSINNVACTTGTPTTTSYGIKDVKTDSQGNVYFWLTQSNNNEVVELNANHTDYGKSYKRDDNNNNAQTLTIPKYGFTLSQTTNHTFPAATYGYNTQAPLNVTVTNNGYMNTGTLNVQLTGDNTNAFTVSTTSITGVDADDNATFTVTPNTTLNAGTTYSATVNVAGANATTQSFNVSFTVNKANQETLTIAAPFTVTYGDNPFTLNTTGGSGNGTVTWTCTTPTVATVTTTGQVNIIGTGEATFNAIKAADQNYIQADATRTIYVEQKNLTVENINVSDKVYDGNTDATLNETPTLIGVVEEDEEYVTLSGTPTFDDKNVGNNKIVSFTNFTLTGTKAGNYTLTQPESTNASITPKNLTVNAAVNNKTYDGNTNATLSGTPTLIGVVEGDNVTLNTVTPSFNDKNVGSNKPITFNTVFSISGTQAGNYTLTQPTSITADITPATLTITGGTVTNKIYDGTNSANVTGWTFSGLQNSEELIEGTDYNVSAVFDNANAGASNRTVEMTVTLAGNDKTNNYNLINGNPYSLTGQTINKRDITISGGTIASKTYDGTTTATVTSLTFDGLVNSETLTLNTDYSASATFDNANAGEGKTVTVSATLLTSLLSNNYNLPDGTYPLTGQILPRDISDAVIDITSPVYTGTQLTPYFTVTDNGLSINAADYDTAWGDNVECSTGGSVTITGTNNCTGDKTVNFTIQKAEQANFAVDPPNIERTYEPAFTRTLTTTGGNGDGDVTWSGDDATVATVNASSGEVTIHGVGTTTVTATKAGDNNYNEATAECTITVSKAVLQGIFLISPASTTSVCGGDPPTLTLMENLGSGNVTWSSNNPSVATVDPDDGEITIHSAGTVTITATKDADPNYDGATATCNITVLLANGDALIISGADTVTYGDNSFTLSTTGGSSRGDITWSGDSEAVATVHPNTGVVTIKGAGETIVTAIKAADDYYSAATATHTITVHPKQLSITGVAVDSKVYDGTTDATIIDDTPTLNGVVAGDEAAVTLNYGAPSFADKDAANGIPISFTNFTLTGGKAANYTLTQPTGITANITKAPLTVTPHTGQSTTYGNPDLTFAYDTEGWVNGEGASLLLSGHLLYDGSGVGSHLFVQGTLTAGNNYNITLEGNVTFLINPAALDVKAADTSRLYGSADPVFRIIYSGFVNGENESVVTEQPTATSNTYANTPVGNTYIITPAGGTVTNYTLSYTNGTLTIDKAPLTATADNVSRDYRDPNPDEFTITYSGFVVDSDNETTITRATATCSATADSPVGEYSITVTGGAADNYYISPVFGILTITPRTLSNATVTITGATGYTGSRLKPDFTVVQDGVTLTEEDYSVSWGDNVQCSTGGTVTLAGQRNYDGSVTKAFPIAKATPTAQLLHFTPLEVTYDRLTHEVTVQQNGGVTGLGSVMALYYNGNTAPPSEVNNYTIAVDLSEGGNYNDISRLTLNGTFRIHPTTPDSSLLNYTIPGDLPYDGNPHPAEVQVKPGVTGLGEPLTVKYNGSADPLPINAGTYVVTLDIPFGSNYDTITGLNLGSFEISKVMPDTACFDYSIEDVRFYDGQPHPVDVTALDTINGMGIFTVLYGGYPFVPTSPGTYEVTLHIEAGVNYEPLPDLYLGTYTIPSPPPMPTIPRAVRFMPLPAGANINYSVGSTHYHGSGNDFTFILNPGVQNLDLTPVVSTAEPLSSTLSYIEILPNDNDSTYTVIIYQLRESVDILISFTSANGIIPFTDNDLVWSTGKQLVLKSSRDALAHIYNPRGTLVQTIAIQANQLTQIPLPTGFYFVMLNKQFYKVLIKD